MFIHPPAELVRRCACYFERVTKSNPAGDRHKTRSPQAREKPLQTNETQLPPRFEQGQNSSLEEKPC